MLVEELLAELQFINDILAKRAENRKDFAEKVVEVITYGVSKVFSAGPLAHPLIAIGQIATDITGDVIQQILQRNTMEKPLTPEYAIRLCCSINNYLALESRKKRGVLSRFL